jgi:hypothetical protein
MRLGILTIAAASVVGFASLAGAGTALSTGVANWKFKAFTALPQSPNSGTVYNNTIAAQGSNAMSIAPNSNWTGGTSLINAGASWVSALTNGASSGLYGLYTYELTLNTIAPGTYEIGGKFTSDNLVDSFKVNGVELLSAFSGPTEKSFKNVFTVPANVASAPITLTIRVYNESTVGGVISDASWNLNNQAYPVGPNAPGSTSNPTGFILSGEAVLVPVPAAAWAGIALLGVGGAIRRRIIVA